MTREEMILEALETIINERGKLRAAGMAIDTLPRDFNAIIDAAHVARHNLKTKMAK